jgi:hypothetical protein
MDKTLLELNRLRYAVRAWTLKAVSHVAYSNQVSRMSLSLPDLSPGKASLSPDSDVLNRPDIQEYIRAVNKVRSRYCHYKEP